MLRSIKILLGGIGLSIVFGLIAYQSFSDAHEAAASLKWPKVSGSVESTHVVQQDVHSKHGGTTYYYEPVVWYTYEVDSDSFRENRIGWTTISYDFEHEAKKFLDEKYPKGKSVEVYYDEHHPHHACLVPGHDPFGKLIGYGCIALIPVVLIVSCLSALGITRNPRF